MDKKAHKPVLVTIPPDWLEAFRRAAAEEELPLSSWMAEACKKRLPADVRRALSVRRSRGRVPKEEQ